MANLAVIQRERKRRAPCILFLKRREKRTRHVLRLSAGVDADDNVEVFVNASRRETRSQLEAN
jgi:hypothetical protein